VREQLMAENGRERLLGAMVMVTGGQGRLLAQLDEALEGHGVELDMYEALAVLAQQPEGRMGFCDLAGRLVLTKSGLTRRVDRLVKRDLVRREANEKDKRAGFAVMTEKGRAEYERAKPVYEDAVMKYFGSKITEGEARQLMAIMKRITDGIDKERALSRSSKAD
jgi:DNA-binding MarR family transcriptional regulator